MHEHFGDWYRIINIAPVHEILEKRWTACKPIIDKITSAQIFELARILFDKEIPSTKEYKDELINSFILKDAAFPPNNNKLEMQLLAGTILIRIVLEKGVTYRDLTAYTLICPALKLSKNFLFNDFITIANNYLVERSIDLRKRDTLINIPKPQWESKIPELSNSITQGDAPRQNVIISEILSRVYSDTIKLIENNKALSNHDVIKQEESDILWWLVGGCSKDLGKPIKNMTKSESCLIISKELAFMTQIIPAPFSIEAIIYKMLDKSIDDKIKTLSFSELHKTNDLNWLNTWVTDYTESDIIDLCPVLFTLTKYIDKIKQPGWQTQFKSTFHFGVKSKLKPEILAYQLYKELLFHKLYQSMN